MAFARQLGVGTHGGRVGAGRRQRLVGFLTVGEISSRIVAAGSR